MLHCLNFTDKSIETRTMAMSKLETSTVKQFHKAPAKLSSRKFLTYAKERTEKIYIRNNFIEQ